MMQNSYVRFICIKNLVKIFLQKDKLTAPNGFDAKIPVSDGHKNHTLSKILPQILNFSNSKLLFLQNVQLT